LLFSFGNFAIVATCGGEETVLRLPLLPFPTGPHGPPQIQRAYDLLRDVETRVFGTSEVFKSAADTKVFEALDAEPGLGNDETEGAALVPELRAGVFDRGLGEECKKPVCEEGGLKQVLESYIPPEERTAPSVVWVDRPGYECLKCALPAYPPLARLARVEGDVELELQLDERTGLVLGVTIASGHSLLQRAALQAAQGWQFQPLEHTEGVKRTKVRLRFSMNCPRTHSTPAE
jgi:TonB family protein